MIDYTLHPLVTVAEGVLRRAGFTVSRIPSPSIDGAVVVAEDRYSLAAIVGADEWRLVAGDLDAIATDLANWAFSRNAEDKQWDLYLIALVAASVVSDDELAELENFQTDTRYVRRLIRHGVTTDAPRLRSALAALLPVDLPVRVVDRDPFKALAAALRSEGVDADLAERTVQRFTGVRGL